MQNEEHIAVETDTFQNHFEGEEGSRELSDATVGLIGGGNSAARKDAGDPDSTKLPANKNSTVAPQTFVKVEKSLASLGFFTPSSRRIKNQKVKRVEFTREINGRRVEVSAQIVPAAIFGLPMTADQDKYLALQQIISDKIRAEGTIANPIRFKSADLLRLLNSNTKTGKNYKDISDWLDVMTATTIMSEGAVYSAGKQDFLRDRVHVFDRAVSVGKIMEDGSVADANYVWLAPWQIDNINQNYLLPIDFETYRELKNHISKALIPLLQIWLYASQKAGAFEKRYEELCEILSLQIYRSPSHITRQFKPSLDELVHHEYLENWRIEKTADRKAYKLVFVHGQKFHRDRRKRLEQKPKSEPLVVAEFEPAEPDFPTPGKITEPLPIVKTSTEPILVDLKGKLVDELAGRGLTPSAVIKLLESLSEEQLETVEDYIDYWDGLRASRKVGEGLLYDLIRKGDPLPTGFETRRARAERQAGEERNRNRAAVEKELEAKYSAYRRDTLDRAIDEVPADEFAKRIEEYKLKIMEPGGFYAERPEMVEQFAQHEIRAEIGRAVQLEPYEVFKRRGLPETLVTLRIDPTGFGIELGKLNPNTKTAPDAIYASPAKVPPVNEGTSVSEQNASPSAL